MGLFKKTVIKQNENAIKLYTEKLNDLEVEIARLYMDSYLEKNGFYKALDVIYGKTDMITPDGEEVPIKVRNKEIEDAIKKIEFCKKTITYMQTVPLSQWKESAMALYRNEDIIAKEKERKELMEFINSLGNVADAPKSAPAEKKKSGKGGKKNG